MARSRADGKVRHFQRWEILLYAGLILAGVAVRLVLNWYQKVDSDEPQHAHVAWAWTQGLISYRDVFDNHTPLFHILSAPILWLLGARPDILFWLRLTMLGLNVLTLLAIGLTTAQFFSRRAALYSVVGLLWFAPFLVDLGEFRTDVLWTTVWAWTIFALIRYGSQVRGAFCIGLLLGVCLSVSLKSILFLAVLLIAWIIHRFVRFSGGSVSAGKVTPRAVAFLGGLLLVPVLLVSFFGLCGALPAMYECIIRHNLTDTGESVTWAARLGQPLVWLALTASYFGCLVVLRQIADPAKASGLVWHILIAGLYCPVLVIGWPVVTRQDFAPFYPLAAVYLGPLIIGLITATRWRGFAPAAGLLVFWAFETGYLVWREGNRRGQDPLEFHQLADVIRLTDPQDYVLDPKGESIFRRRPIYPVLELFTLAQFASGRLKDDFPEQLVAHRVMLAWSSDRYPPRTQRFLRDNYLRLGRLLVAGKWLGPNEGVYTFSIVVPGDYTILGSVHPMPGTLNGHAFSGSGFFDAGQYTFIPKSPQGNMPLVWERARYRFE